MVAPEQYFPVLIMFISLNKVILTVDSVDEIISLTTEMKATKQYFPVALFVMLYKVVVTSWTKSLNDFESPSWNYLFRLDSSTHIRKYCCATSLDISKLPKKN